MIEIKAYRAAITGLVLQDVPFEDTTLLCDVSLGKPRPVIPREWTPKVFTTVHFLSHSGPQPTQQAIADRLVCHGLTKDVKKWCIECHSCQAVKIQQQTKAPLFSQPPLAGHFLSLFVISCWTIASK